MNKPSPDLKNLIRLIGKWKISGDAKGQVEFNWLEGGFFLKQDVEIEHAGRKIKGIEIIGHLQRLGDKPSKELLSRFYSFTEGLTLDYVYLFDGDVLTIWFGRIGSENFYRAKFSKDGNSFCGAWQWPGGGYTVVGTRID